MIESFQNIVKIPDLRRRLLYTFGRTLAYLTLAVVLVATALSVPQISMFLQKYMHMLLGPILILVGMFLIGLIQVSFGGSGISEGMQKRVEASGIWGALLLGLVFALSFCPTSAALFFGSLIPLSLNANSSVLLPVIYGVGTALPVIVFAFILFNFLKTMGYLILPERIDLCLLFAPELQNRHRSFGRNLCNSVTVFGR